MMEQVKEINVLNERLKNDVYVFLKHSSTCGTSASAFDQFLSFVNDNQRVHTGYLIVQEDRELSNVIAELFEVKHESPQLLIFQKGRLKWHTSHRGIRKDTIEEQLLNLAD
ncbi:MAG: thioredoxin family protein [Bacillales bacterium]|jgi:bacillithiol system protein YtxJ|nr:thioredoxin family protein [Bacillales bacterium]